MHGLFFGDTAVSERTPETDLGSIFTHMRYQQEAIKDLVAEVKQLRVDVIEDGKARKAEVDTRLTGIEAEQSAHAKQLENIEATKVVSKYWLGVILLIFGGMQGIFVYWFQEHSKQAAADHDAIVVLQQQVKSLDRR